MTWPVKDTDLTKLGKAICKGAKGIITGADVQFGELTLTGPADRIVEALTILRELGLKILVRSRHVLSGLKLAKQQLFASVFFCTIFWFNICTRISRRISKRITTMQNRIRNRITLNTLIKLAHLILRSEGRLLVY